MVNVRKMSFKNGLFQSHVSRSKKKNVEKLKKKYIVEKMLYIELVYRVELFEKILSSNHRASKIDNLRNKTMCFLRRHRRGKIKKPLTIR